MKTIYLMRHGETLFNTMDVNQGQCDSPLTENGIRQAQKAKAWFDGQGILLVSHGMAIRRFLTRVPDSDVCLDSFIGNCGIVKLTFDNGKFTVEQIINPNA